MVTGFIGCKEFRKFTFLYDKGWLSRLSSQLNSNSYLGSQQLTYFLYLYVLVPTFLIKEPCLFYFLALLPNTESETKQVLTNVLKGKCKSTYKINISVIFCSKKIYNLNDFQ